MALASAARKAGIADDPFIKTELKDIDKAILAVSYDRKINADKGPMPAFGFISEDQIKAFWADDTGKEPSVFDNVSWIWSKAGARWQEGEFDQFLEVKNRYREKARTIGA